MVIGYTEEILAVTSRRKSQVPNRTSRRFALSPPRLLFRSGNGKTAPGEFCVNCDRRLRNQRFAVGSYSQQLPVAHLFVPCGERCCIVHATPPSNVQRALPNLPILRRSDDCCKQPSSFVYAVITRLRGGPMRPAFVIILHAILHTRSHHLSLRAALRDIPKINLRALGL